jgi:hypothetical protein
MSQESTARAALGVGGPVIVADRVFQVKPLELDAEIEISDEMRRLAFKQLGHGGYFAEARPLLDWLNANGMQGAAAAHIKNLSDLQAKKELPSGDAAEQARRTPEGVALELFLRTRDTHPDVGKEDIAAVITSVNAPAIHASIKAAISKDANDPH